MSQIGDYKFYQTFCFMYFDLYCLASSNNYHAMIVIRNEYFSDMQHSQPHMTLYRVDIFLSWGGIIYRSAESLIMILFYASIVSLIPPSSWGVAIML